ncbi:prefoldin subunit [Thermococcus gorgonarius]|uniref:ATP-binding protein n=1 Tax=Thermococcus gorgonarius TaxID=71997 RepID=A0A2Z2M5Y4_THEGO|nr:prefoldin subunit [Thermococcus gorgonarius]ASJ00519.1 ATP-binding protein [Thermococcus gorgonarius]
MEAVKAYELNLQLRQVRELRQTLELKMKELDYAEGLISSSKAERKIFRAFSDIIVEVTKDEALEHIERMRLLYKSEIEKLRKKEKELMEELSKLRV